MKIYYTFVAIVLAAMFVSSAVAQRPDRDRREGDRPREGQRPEGREDGPRRGPPREGEDRPARGPEGAFRGFRPPIIVVLDADEDGVISAEEIKNASKALAKLDKNEDGKITADELRPDFGDRPRPEGGRFEGRGPRGGPEGGRPEGRGPRPEGEGGDRPERPRRPE